MLRCLRVRALMAVLGGAASLGASACASGGPVAPAVAPAPPVSVDRKVAWILRLEQQRTLRDADVSSPGGATTPRTIEPATAAALDALARDPDAAIRRRSVIAVGRVGMAAGVPILVSALADTDADVRAAAAFALGLLGTDGRDGARDLRAALEDPWPIVRARAAEALGLLGDASAAPAIAEAASGCAPWLAAMTPDDEEPFKEPEIELCRLSIYALARLRDFDRLAAVVLTADGQPVSRWWPVAYALQRVADPRSTPALLALATTPGVNTAGFALRGLGAIKDRAAVPVAKAAATDPALDIKVRIAAVRALGQIAGPAAIEPLLELLGSVEPLPENLTTEIIAAVGGSGHTRAFDVLVDYLSHPSPALRAAALEATAKLSPDGFLVVLAGLGRDTDWTVRASLARTLSALPADRVGPVLEDLATDEDVRVRGPAIEALVAVRAPGAVEHVLRALEADDFMVRSVAARLVGETRPASGAARLVAAYARGASDRTFVARAAALEALALYAGDEARTTLRQALSDPEWPVRWRAAGLLHGLGELDAEPERPAPLRQPVEFFESAELIRPRFSPRVFIETARGVVEVELNVVDAPLTSWSFMELSRAGFFAGMKIHRVVPAFVVQAGDPRGDGDGGPGYSIADELSSLPYLRGTLGMALNWRDTAGSQWFITLSPQPHLDARYTVFGRVVGGWEVLDRLAPWDVIERVRIWDGVQFQ